jgi:phage-related tail fiber protein
MKLESQLQVYTSAGVAPFAVNQTTLVTNLNAQYLEGQIGSYYRNAGNLDAGALLAARLPAFTGGDVTSTAGTVALTLALAGNAGTYRSVTTDTKGRVTAGTNPTTLAGYGITDALLLSGGTLTGELVINYANGRQRITDGTNTLVMGMWDTVNVRIEATGRPL